MAALAAPDLVVAELVAEHVTPRPSSTRCPGGGRRAMRWSPIAAVAMSVAIALVAAVVAWPDVAAAGVLAVVADLKLGGGGRRARGRRRDLVVAELAVVAVVVVLEVARAVLLDAGRVAPRATKLKAAPCCARPAPRPSSRWSSRSDPRTPRPRAGRPMSPRMLSPRGCGL